MSEALSTLEEAKSEAYPVSNAKLGMWVFLASEVMFFSAFIGSYIIMRLGSLQWKDPHTEVNVMLAAVNTLVLITSSFTVVKGLSSIQKGDQGGLKLYWGVTILLGLAFLVIKGIEYNEKFSHGLFPSKNLFYGFYFLMTGFHALHVLIGVITNAILWVCAFKGRYSENDYESIELAGLYWHFVDVVWIVLFPLVYLM